MARQIASGWDPLPPLPRRIRRRQQAARIGTWIWRIAVVVGWMLLTWDITGQWARGGH